MCRYSSFVTFYNTGNNRLDVKIAALLAFLLTPSTVLLAATEASHLQKVDHGFVPVVVDKADTIDAGIVAGNDAYQPTFSYPVWPDRGEIKTEERLPPPPPGPYMSSALSDYSVRGLSFEQEYDDLDAKDSTDNNNAAKLSSDTFSPDKSWPELGKSRRWMPDNGYQYVTPHEYKSNTHKYSYTQIAPSKTRPLPEQGYATDANRPVANGYAYNRNTPNTDISGSRYMPRANTYPAINESPYASKAVTSNTRSGSLYNDPAMNRFDYRRAVPMNRM